CESFSLTTLKNCSQTKSACALRKLAAAVSMEARAFSRFGSPCAGEKVVKSGMAAANRTFKTDFRRRVFMRNSRRLSRLFPLDPDLVTLHMSGAVCDGLVFQNGSGSRDRLDDVQHLLTQSGIILGRQCRSLDVINEPTAAVGLDHYSGLMRKAFDRFVLEVDPVRRKEDEEQDERDHDVIVESSTLV